MQNRFTFHNSLRSLDRWCVRKIRTKFSLPSKYCGMHAVNSNDNIYVLRMHKHRRVQHVLVYRVLRIRPPCAIKVSDA